MANYGTGLIVHSVLLQDVLVCFIYFSTVEIAEIFVHFAV